MPKWTDNTIMEVVIDGKQRKVGNDSNVSFEHYIQLEIDGKPFYYNFNSLKGTPYTADTLPVMPDVAMSVFVIVAGGYYSNVSGIIYRSAEDNVLKATMHGMYTDNGTSFSYLNLSDASVTFISDNVVKV